MSASARTRILFVDDEPLLLELLQATLEPMQPEWESTFADSGPKALALMESRPFDVVISDMRMPGMTGAQLLNEVMQRYPATIRLILSGYAEREEVMRCVGATHQFLAKPFQLATLIATLKRVGGLKERLRSQEIQQLVANTHRLPSLPAVYFQILQAVQDPESPIEQIGQIVAMDPGLTARILQLVNSAFFGFSRSVSSPEEAVLLLGLGNIRSLALTVHLFSAFEAVKQEGCSVEQVWTHSLRVGQLAKQLATLESGDAALAEQAFTAGMLHDIGKLVLVENRGLKYLELMGRAQREQQPLIEVEEAVLHATHAEVGAYLLDLWGLPSPLVEAVALHHAPAQTAEFAFSPLTAVHVANVLEQQTSNTGPEAVLDRLDAAYLKRLKLEGKVKTWRKQLCPC